MAMTLRELLRRWEEALVQGPHPERARRDAETLLLHAMGKTRAWLLGHYADEAADEAGLATLLLRRLRGEPIQYITGQTEFYGLPFRVAPGVLIPRPETEHLVEEALRLAANLPTPNILDIGTGSGAISVALAHALPQASVTTVDISPDAIAMARENAALNGVEDRIRFLEGDLLGPVAGMRFERVLSNPPYVPLEDLATLAAEVREHEPHSALFAGRDGLEIYRRLIPAAREHLVAGGWLLLEIGYGQQPALHSLLEVSGYAQIHFLPDYQGIPRVACAQPN